MNETTRKHLIETIDYLWEDEAESWAEEDGLNCEHIFISLVILKIYTYRNETSGRDIKDQMYADSPFDLVTEEDDMYRNLVDQILSK